MAWIRHNFAHILSLVLETNLLINCFLEKQFCFLRILFRISQPDIEWMIFCSYCKRVLLYSSLIFTGVFSVFSWSSASSTSNFLLGKVIQTRNWRLSTIKILDCKQLDGSERCVDSLVFCSSCASLLLGKICS